jgi:hypothetical protein
LISDGKSSTPVVASAGLTLFKRVHHFCPTFALQQITATPSQPCPDTFCRCYSSGKCFYWFEALLIRIKRIGSALRMSDLTYSLSQRTVQLNAGEIVELRGM